VKRESSDGICFPNLVQRVDVRHHTDGKRKGVDKFFHFDYMGSSEFEWGSLPKALKEMRSKLDATWQPTKIEFGERVVWFIGDPSLVPSVVEFFLDQIQEFKDRQIRLKERSHIYESFDPNEKFDSFKNDGWWAIDAKPPWVAFKKKDHAETWLKCLVEKPE